MLKKGQTVEIYHDPITQKQHEGKAKLISPIIQHDSDVTEYWNVEFEIDMLGEPNTTHEQEQRWIWSKDEKRRLRVIKCMKCQCHKSETGSPTCCSNCNS